MVEQGTGEQPQQRRLPQARAASGINESQSGSRTAGFVWIPAHN